MASLENLGAPMSYRSRTVPKGFPPKPYAGPTRPAKAPTGKRHHPCAAHYRMAGYVGPVCVLRGHDASDSLAFAEAMARRAAEHAGRQYAATPRVAAKRTVRKARTPLRAVPAASVVQGRPGCPRCGQSFRKSGVGYRWHIENRPQCGQKERAA